MKKRLSDDAIAVMVKNKLADMIQGSSVAEEVVALANAFTKLRAVELKQEEGDWGEELPSEARPLGDHNDVNRDPPRR